MNATTLTKWQPYPAYKNSGVEWLGEIPEHWEVKRLKYVTGINQDVLSENTNSDYVLRYVDISNVDSNGLILNSQEMRFENAPSRARRMVKHGDTIISTVRTYLRAIAFINKPPGNLIVSTGFAVIRPKPELHPKFLWRVVQSSDFVDAVVSYSEGVSYPAINSSVLANFMVWFPSINEQLAIADFLDRETAEIDALIAKKEGLIELLQEKRTALISHAVTKGIDSTVKMKDSGVGWLGEIPEHWNLRKLKFVSKVEISYVDKKSFEHEIEVFLCNYIDVYRNDFITKEIHFMKATATNDEITRNSIKKGDIIVTKDSETPNDIANPALVTDNFENVICGYHLAHIKPNQKFILGNYLLRLFQNKCFNGQFTVAANGITRFGLNSYSILNAFVSIPPIEEQKQITKYLDRETAKTDALISKSREGIDKLKEYRTALISAAATGKIDVRDYQSGE